MYDVRAIKKRYFEVKLYATYENDDDNVEDEVKEMIVNVSPAKFKLLKKLQRLSKDAETKGDDDNDFVAEFQSAIKKLLSQNKEKIKVPIEYIDELNIDEMNGMVFEYFAWIENKIANDPN